MPLLVLNYHRAHAAVDGNSPEMLDSHFEHIAGRYPTLLPGDEPPISGVSLCLCFDGAYFDFFEVVLPLLRKHGLRAVLAVSPGVIMNEAVAPSRFRTEMASTIALAHPAAEGFCTWDELHDIAASGHVAIAALGYTQRPIDGRDADLETEMHVPRTLLAARLGVPVESFVFPYGRFTRLAVREAKSAYRHVFANGGAINRGWDEWLVHRVCGDNLRTPREPFEAGRMLSYRVRRWWNRAIRR